jgi:undecaprenyl diphosphate synthase
MDQANELRHVAVILDGNGRWAAQHGVERKEGHLAGANRVVDFMNYIGKYDSIRYVTLYAFSTENWKRSPSEVATLMGLLGDFITSHEDELLKYGIRLHIIGDLERLPVMVRGKLRKVLERTAVCDKAHLTVALSYGSRQEITLAAKSLARDVMEGRLKLEDIDEDAMSARLQTAGTPDPDLIIRTAGEQRLSNFLLWQASYAEFIFLPVMWPDFGETQFKEALDEYSRRQRRYGGA